MHCMNCFYGHLNHSHLCFKAVCETIRSLINHCIVNDLYALNHRCTLLVHNAYHSQWNQLKPQCIVVIHQKTLLGIPALTIFQSLF